LSTFRDRPAPVSRRFKAFRARFSIFSARFIAAKNAFYRYQSMKLLAPRAVFLDIFLSLAAWQGLYLFSAE